MTELANTNTSGSGSCLHCIDGMAPTTSTVIGHCYQTCPECQPQCPCCHGRGRYPAWTNDMVRFAAAYNSAGLIPVLCHTCGGVLAITPTTNPNTEAP